jgi:branched-chain amino acid transport system permease protein
VLSAIAAAAIERVLIRPFDPSNHLAIVIVTLSVLLILDAIAGVIWAFDGRAFPNMFPGRNQGFDLLGAHIEWADLLTWVTILAAVALVTLLLQKTKTGLAFRSVSTNLESSRLIGINIGRTMQFGWALAAAVGTLAGSLVARTTLIEPTYMGRVLIYSFAAATLGGLDSLGGAVVGGIIIGLVQTMGGGYIDAIGSELSSAVALFVIVLVLLIKPSGLFGSKRVERV